MDLSPTNHPNYHRPISQYATDIFRDWDFIDYEAERPLTAMCAIDQITEPNAADVVRDFLSKAQTWRGPNARRIKFELKEILRRAPRAPY